MSAGATNVIDLPEVYFQKATANIEGSEISVRRTEAK